MKVEKLDKNIWVVHNFILEEELNPIIEELESFDFAQWNKDMGLDPESFWVNRATTFDSFSLQSRTLIDKISKRVFESFKDYREILQIGNVNRTLSDGRSMEYHVDNANNSDKDNIYGLILYLNDNYTGGKIHYKDLDIEYQPKRGDLVVHYAGYLHGVTQVISGVRYILTSFVRGTKDTSFLGEKIEL